MFNVFLEVPANVTEHLCVCVCVCVMSLAKLDLCNAVQLYTKDRNSKRSKSLLTRKYNEKSRNVNEVKQPSMSGNSNNGNDKTWHQVNRLSTAICLLWTHTNTWDSSKFTRLHFPHIAFIYYCITDKNRRRKEMKTCPKSTNSTNNDGKERKACWGFFLHCILFDHDLIVSPVKFETI